LGFVGPLGFPGAAGFLPTSHTQHKKAMDVLHKVKADLEALGFTICYTDKLGNECGRFPVHAERMEMGKVEDGHYLGVVFPTINKMTTDWAIQRFCTLIEAKQKKQSVKWGELFAKAGIRGASFYPTSYGFGMYALVGDIQDKAKQVHAFLQSKGIQYKNEFSEARWVYRFVVSTSKDNVSKLLS